MDVEELCCAVPHVLLGQNFGNICHSSHIIPTHGTLMFAYSFISDKVENLWIHANYTIFKDLDA